MTADRTIFTPSTLVFSPSGKLVSRSEGLGFLSIGLPFDSLVSGDISLSSLLEGKPFPEEGFQIKEYGGFNAMSHVMKDPTGKALALIITLLSPRLAEDAPATIDEKMIRMDRLAKIGQLASSIAHEIRNPLAGISANVQVLSEIVPDKGSYQKFFEVILEEIARVEKIIKDLLDYSRNTKPSLVPTSLNNVFEHLKTLVSAQLSKQKIRLEFLNTTALPEIHADFGQLIQIFLNCIMNSSQAMTNGGTITVECEPRQEILEIRVRDNGIGIKKELLDKIFEPFFTTRAKGLGLGLSVTKKIMEDHLGKIEIRSMEGAGTDVILTFPLNSPPPSV